MLAPDTRLTRPPSGNADKLLSDVYKPQQTGHLVVHTEQADLRHYFAVILKRKWLVISVVVIITTLVAIYMYQQPSVYEAETMLRIERRNESFLRAKDIVINTASDPVYWQTQLKLLENPQLMRQIVLTLDLQDNPAFFGTPARNGLLPALRRIFSSEKPAPVKVEKHVENFAETDVENLTAEQRALMAPYVNTLLANLTIEPVTGTNLVKLRFSHTDPEIAMKVTDTLAQLFIYNDVKRETLGSQNASLQLARQIADLQLAIRRQEEERLNYMRNHELPLGNVKGQNLTVERLGTLSSQLLAAENERHNLQSAYEAAKKATDVWSVPAVQENQSVQELRTQIRDLEQKRAALLAKYTAEWPGVIEVDEQIKRLKEDLNRSPYEIINAMGARYEAALAREAKLRRAYEQERNAANQQSLSEISLNDLNQKLETNKQLYNTLFQRQKELELDSTDWSYNIAIATPSELPLAPVGPPRTRNIAISFLLSLGVGIGLALLLQRLDDTLRSAEEVASYTQLPMLTVIPAMRAQRPSLRSRLLEPNKGGGSSALALIEDARSPITEAYRHLRTSLLFSSNLHPPKSLLVTSGQPMEGKTTTAINTAVIFAQTGADVLLLDCDLRRPRVHAHFNLPNGPGLAECLSGEADVAAALHPYDKLPNLQVITSGRVPSNPAELLGSEEMRLFLSRMSERFTHIIIDSPPTISFTDAVILSTLVDGVMIVVHAGKSSRSAVQRVRQQFFNIGAHVYGTILNNAKLESRDYYYNYYSSYYYPADEEDSTAPAARPAQAAISVTSSQIEQAFEKFLRETKEG